MSVLDGFYTTWNNARETFGQGTPQPGTDFDNSSKLRDLGSNVDNAKPAGWWSGAAASGYEKANDDHKQVFGKLAELDQKLAEKVNQSAQVVENGRQNLDAVKQWVTDAANSLPPGKQRDMFLMQIANKGLSQLTDVVKQSNDELTGVGNGIRGLKGDYDDAGDQKHAKGDGDTQALGSEEQKKAEEDAKRQAEKDVHDALAGDQGAAARVEQQIGAIKPGEELSPSQASYLSQMQAQQHGMSVDELHEAEQRLGDHKDIIGDSWQLMSNKEVWTPHTDLKEGALDDPNWRVRGGLDQLPQSVQNALREPDALTPLGDGVAGLTHDQDLKQISDIVRDGNANFQTGTDLDREMITAADKIMDTNLGPLQPMGDPDIVQGIFDAAGRDHLAVRDHLFSSNSDDFLHDVNAVEWNDNGKAAASLFSWTHDAASGPEAGIAGDTAEKYASYIGSHNELMNINGQTLGELNPELVKGYAHGLTPYMSDLAGLSSADPRNTFDFIDTENPTEKPVAKGIFSVLSTDESAYKEFHSAADARILANSYEWANDVKNHVPVSPNDTRLLDCAALQALEKVGTTNAANALGLNQEQVETQRREAYEMGVKMLSGVGSVVPGVGPALGPGIDNFGSAMANSVFGDPRDFQNMTVRNLDAGESARFALNALIAQDVPLNYGNYDLNDSWYEYAPIDPNHPELGDARFIRNIQGLQQVNISDGTMEENLTSILNQTLGGSSPTTAMKDQYDDIVANPEPREPSK